MAKVGVDGAILTGRPARLKAMIGGNAPSELGLDALLDFRMEVTPDSARTVRHRARLTIRLSGCGLSTAKSITILPGQPLCQGYRW
jgi:hypothetical protein